MQSWAISTSGILANIISSKTCYTSERLSIDATYSLDNKFTINKAFPADKKTSPVRWLIVFCSVVSVSIFYIFLISFLYLIDEFKHEFEQE